MNRSLIRRHLIRFTIFLIVFAVSGLVTVAQQATPTLEPGAIPNAPTLEPAAQATAQALEVAWLADYESRSIFDFRVAYLIAPNTVEADSVMSEQSFTEALGAVIFHTWEDFVVENELEAFQIVLVHDSAYETLDTQWTQYAYRNQVIFVGVGMPFEHAVEMTGDRCLKEPNPGYSDQFADWIFKFTYTVTYDDESQRPTLDPADFEPCRGRPPVIGDTFQGVAHGIKNIPLIQPEFLISLVGSLVLSSMDYNME